MGLQRGHARGAQRLAGAGHAGRAGRRRQSDIDINYFRDEDQFLYTALHPRFKEAVEYVKGLYDEQLISQTYITETCQPPRVA